MTTWSPENKMLGVPLNLQLNVSLIRNDRGDIAYIA